jgi:predicted transcriptional regulator
MADRTDIEDFSSKAFQFLVRCNELTEGNESRRVSMDKVATELGLEAALKVAVTDYLLEEGLIKLPELGGTISITAKGIARVEAVQS